MENFDPNCVAEIRQRLDQSRDMGVTVAFAIESGSRAWGFPSPDSDYDCRFIYVRSVADHLGLKPMRDVIEYPIIGDIDAGGWDLRKALNLALGGNAVVNEWAKSPHVYEEVAGFRLALIELLDEILQPQLVANHYTGLALNQAKLLGGFDGDVKLKKLFYLIRPLLNLRWMEKRDYLHLPPMDIQTLMAECELDADIIAELDALIARKAQTRELGAGATPIMLAEFLSTALARFQARETAKPDTALDRAGMAEEFYRHWVKALDH